MHRNLTAEAADLALGPAPRWPTRLPPRLSSAPGKLSGVLAQYLPDGSDPRRKTIKHLAKPAQDA
jgi:hypothetical protein